MVAMEGADERPVTVGEDEGGIDGPAVESTPEAVPERADPAPEVFADQPHGPLPALALAALGVVFGDIGTSPLYSMQTVFTIEDHAVVANRDDVFGVVSMVFWAVTVVVSYKYVFLVMRADNEGEGGILALVALLRARLQGRRRLSEMALLMGIVGAALFYGDSVITPAISVMSAIEGLAIVDTPFEALVLPVSIVILTGLFSVQRFGTAAVGRAFGAVMIVWFGVLAILGIPQIAADPEILEALSPTYALAFAVQRPFIAFVALGAAVLTITGAEALYADMGHFGAGPIRLSWFAFVLPALVLNYLGQGALILRDPSAVDNPFFRMAPDWARIPLVILATLATVIASQAVISGAYSVSRQANRLGLLPRLKIKHTSKVEGGQIYIGSINWILYAGVLALIGIFQSSASLAHAYGLAVTGTLLLTTVIFLYLAHFVWRVATWKLVVAVCTILVLELAFLAANLLKVFHGGWLPLVVAAVVITIMTTWRRGVDYVHSQRDTLEGSLDAFIDEMRTSGVRRVPGLAVFPHPDRRTTPLALRQNVAFNQVLHEHVVLVSIVHENVPHIRHVDRASVHDLGYADDGIVQVKYRVGFNDSQDVPKALDWARGKTDEVDLDSAQARYFLSSLRLRTATPRTWHTWRRSLFLWLSHNAAERTQVFHLPPERTVVIGGELAIGDLGRRR